MDYTITNFFIDYFIKSMPVTIFMFLFLIFSASKKKDSFQDVLAFVVVTNLLVYSIVNLMHLNDFSEAALTTLAIAISASVYDKDIGGMAIITKSITSLIFIMVIQIVTVYPFMLIINFVQESPIEVLDIANNLVMSIFVQLSAIPIQILVLYKLYLIKRRT